MEEKAGKNLLSFQKFAKSPVNVSLACDKRFELSVTWPGYETWEKGVDLGISMTKQRSWNAHYYEMGECYLRGNDPEKCKHKWHCDLGYIVAIKSLVLYIDGARKKSH